MPLTRLIAVLAGFALLYVLQYVLLWPWYYAIGGAVVVYVAARVGGEAIAKKRSMKRSP